MQVPTDSLSHWSLVVLGLVVVGAASGFGGAWISGYWNRRKTNAEAAHHEMSGAADAAHSVVEMIREIREAAKENRELRGRVDELCDLREADKRECDEKLAEQDRRISVMELDKQILEGELKKSKAGTLPQGRDAILD